MCWNDCPLLREAQKTKERRSSLYSNHSILLLTVVIAPNKQKEFRIEDVAYTVIIVVCCCCLLESRSSSLGVAASPAFKIIVLVNFFHPFLSWARVLNSSRSSLVFSFNLWQ